MYKIAVLGERDSIYGFATLGLETFPVEDAESGERTLKTLAAKDYAIIYITEGLMAQIKNEVAKYDEQRLPAIISIPGTGERNGVALENLQKLVIQAVGSDIFGNE